MTRYLTIVLILVASALTPYAGYAADDAPNTVTLNVVHTPGKVDHLLITSNTVGSIRMFEPLPEQKFSQEFTELISARCLKKNPDGSADYEWTIERMTMSLSTGQFVVDFDSASFDPAAESDPAKRMVGRIFNAMTGCKFGMTEGADGQVLKVSGVSDMVQKAISAVTEDEEIPPFVKGFINRFAQMFDDDTLFQQMDSFYQFWPKSRTMTIGKTWTNEWDMPFPILNTTFVGHGEYELLGVTEYQGRRCARIKINESFGTQGTGTTAGTGAEPSPSTGPADFMARMQFDMESSDGRGLAYVDIDTGDIVRTQQKQSMVIKVGMKPDPNAESEAMRRGVQSITERFNSAVTLKLLTEEQFKKELTTVKTPKPTGAVAPQRATR
jgi:hypothetical protein